MRISRLTYSGSLPFVVVLLLWVLASCSVTRHVPEGKYLLRSNTVNIKSDQAITRRGELNEQLRELVVQRPNTYALGIPYKVYLYNARYKRFLHDTAALNFQLKAKAVEKPVVFDSSLMVVTARALQAYLFHQGYFYAEVKDTARYRGKKAFVTHTVNTGLRYLIRQTTLDIDDSTVRYFVSADTAQTFLQPGQPFTYPLIDEERSRIANVLRNAGYYKFTQENIFFVTDTAHKELLHGRPAVNINIIIRKTDDSSAYRRYRIGRVIILPDFIDRADLRDSNMINKTVNNISIRYHNYYVRESVIIGHNFLLPGDYYSQQNYDRTTTSLNELGLFQYVRPFMVEDSTLPHDSSLRCVILLSPAKKYDVSASYQFSTGSYYAVGADADLTLRNRNVLRGANHLTTSLSGGVELGYDQNHGGSFGDHFYVFSKNAGINTTLEFPKFLSPIRFFNFRQFNQPHTIVGVGFNVLDRVNYFTLTNSVANFTYEWRQNATNTWDLTPGFVNVVLPAHITDSFQHLLDSNTFLRHSYERTFIEGESLSFTFSDLNSRLSRYRYSFIKASIEEAGGLLGGINAIGNVLSGDLGLQFSQYIKLDLDARHYFRRQHSTFAVRGLLGIGIPYDKSTTLPYIKQYFAGGAYSIRGWRVRQLGPGSYYDSADVYTVNSIDRTGDIHIEANVEYRFDMVQLFKGAIHLNGALFADAGNIWLAHADPHYPGGEFALNTFGQDIAVSTGAGARADIGSLFILRFDVAFPIKKPYVPQNSGWVLDDIRFLDPNWRSNNIVLNIAIGYPF